MNKQSRWIGVLEVQDKYSIGDTPIFVPNDETDPYVIRFKVKPLAWLPKEKTIPIHDNRVWEHLSFTKNVDKNSSLWTVKIRNSLNQLDDNDGHFLENLILDQVVKQEVFEINEVEYQKLITVSKCDYLELKKTIYGEKALAKLTVRVACRRHRYRST
ncbi:hypothetical protein SR1949_11890 [Sphaerospermopsis reniformis]|uniref:EVE domain-containing protein n=1 Tax=Sphaerospermopsis reniformis TaxID=531300 RepID=A0A479ZTR9_9CYAN|nr:hypothetical protein [Sphaerospermopsis reniformis]GCL36089.1 hypothetical protein SR1949_11890 [Sphaerospermopsis reniformis]